MCPRLGQKGTQGQTPAQCRWQAAAWIKATSRKFQGRRAWGLTSCQVLDDLLQGIQNATLGLKRDLGLGKQLEDEAAGRETAQTPRRTRLGCGAQWPMVFQVLFTQQQALCPPGEAAGGGRPLPSGAPWLGPWEGGATGSSQGFPGQWFSTGPQRAALGRDRREAPGLGAVGRGGAGGRAGLTGSPGGPARV